MEKERYIGVLQGYEPFGSLLPGRNYSSDSYRFGFNGKENDNEVFGSTGTFQDYGKRAYDTRVGRLISIDPYTFKYPWYTPYQFAGNSPIRNVDQLGLQPASAVEKWHMGPDNAYTYKGTGITIHRVEGFWVYEKQSNTSNEKMNTWIWWNEKDYAWQEFIPVTQEKLDYENAEATGRSVDHMEKGILGLAVTGSTLGLGSIPAVSKTVSSLFTATLRQRAIAGGVNLATQSIFNDRPMELDINGFAASVATGNPVFGSAWSSLGTLTVESGWTTNNSETAIPQFVMGTIGGIAAGNAASSVWKELAKTSPAGSLIGEVATGMLGSTAVTGIAKTEAEETKH